LGGAVVAGVGGDLVKTIVGAVIMGLCGFCTLYLMRGVGSGWKVEVARLGVIVPVCVVVYGVMAKLLKNEMLSLVTGGKKR
jgi:hypothetical protein